MNKGISTRTSKVFDNFTIVRDFVFRIQGWVGILLFAALTSVITLQVSSRYIFHNPVLWTEEVARYLFLWVVMMGSALSVKTERHFAIEFFDYDKVHNIPLRKMLRMVPHLAFITLALIMVITGSQYVEMSKLRMGQMARINLKYIFVSIPISGGTIILYCLHHIMRIVLKDEKTQSDVDMKTRES